MKLYENVIIGNFLYALGLKIGISFPRSTSPEVGCIQKLNSPKSLNFH